MNNKKIITMRLFGKEFMFTFVGIQSSFFKILNKCFFGIVYSYRYLLFIFIFILFGTFNLNVTKNVDQQGVGGYSTMQEVGAPPVVFGEEIKYYDETITRLLENNDFNGNVLIARYGIILYNRSFGYGDFENKAPLNDSTIFQVASIGKTFAAAAVLLLQQRGLLELDDPMIKHIPEFPYPDMTIRHLLTHTSGLQNYMWLIENRWRSKRIPGNEDILDLFVKYTLPVNFQPGQRFDYSNTGYVFLALLIERVSGKSYAGFIEEKIFEPLNMNHSFVKDLNNPGIVENLAYGYRRFRNSYIRIPHNYIDGVMGDKGIYSSVIDLYKWDQALYNNSLLPDNLIREAFERTRLNNSRTVSYGLGWRLQTFLDRKVVHHPGRWNGYRTSFKRFIDDNTTIIVLNNTSKDITCLIEDLQHIVFCNEIERFASAYDTLYSANHPLPVHPVK